MENENTAPTQPLFCFVYDLSPEDQIKANEVNGRFRYRHTIVASWVGSILALVGALFHLQSPGMRTIVNDLFLGSFMCAGLALSLMLSPGMSARKNIRRYNVKLEHTTLSFFPWGYLCTVPNKGDERGAWANLVEALETPECILLYIGPAGFYVLPSRVFTSDHHYDSFVALARGHIPRWHRHRMG